MTEEERRLEELKRALAAENGVPYMDASYWPQAVPAQPMPQPAAPKMPQPQQQQMGMPQAAQEGGSAWYKNPNLWDTLALGFNSMTMRPDPGFAQMIGNRMQTRTKEAERAKAEQKAKEQQNKTLEYLAKNHPQLAQLVSAGVPVKDALAVIKEGKMPEWMQKIAFALQNPEQAQQLRGMGLLGSQPAAVVNVGDKMDTEREKAYIRNMEKLSEAGQNAGELRAQIDLLTAIGESPDLNAIPDWMRRMIPAGMNNPIDAYNAVLQGVASLLRVPGTGSQSDRDVTLMMNRAGDISASLEARRVAQSGIRMAADRLQERDSIAQRYLIGEIDKAEANRQLNELNKQGLFNDEIRNQLEAIGVQTKRVINGKTYIKKNGQWYETGN